MTKDALLEIGSEELPASFIGPAMTQLKEIAQRSLQEQGLPFESISVYGTPRRLAAVITGLADRTADRRLIFPGPPIERAKDPSGQWTAAATGFAKKYGQRPEALLVENGRLCAVQQEKGQPTRQLLAQLFPQWIKQLQFPKSMVWEPSQFRYPRPIRWLSALYGTDVVGFTLAGVRSGKSTLGLSLQSGKKIGLASAAKYFVSLKNNCVLVDPAARKDAIRRMAEQAVKRIHGHVLMSESLLEQVANLVEHPVAIVGSFDAAYLDLPSEVLITCLEHHQKFFPVSAHQEKGKLLAHFVGIRNGMSVHQEVVREGYERVLAARLADARFFHNQDRRTKLEAKVEALQGVMFQEKLGSLFDKKERVKAMLSAWGEHLPNAGSLDAAFRTADLCKADLVTDMVREFPELQGIMARIYALADGEAPDVADALEQHYWPITLTGALPGNATAALVALADKLDTLAGDFAVGLIPTGSADPYGLRRAAVGVLRILEAQKWPLSLEKLLRSAVDQQPAAVRTDADGTVLKLMQFMKQRLAALLEERGYRFDEIDAVLAAGIGEVPDALARVIALHDLRTRAEFEPLSVAFKRGMNIVRQAAKASPESMAGDGGGVRSDLLKEPCEQTLFQALEQAGSQVNQHMQTRAYREALESMVALREPLDGFFNGVMVMAEDSALRANRLALMSRLVRMFSQIADFSKLQNA